MFTEYRDTQKWLHGLLASRDLATQDRLLTLFGGMSSDDREVIKAAFQAHPDQSKVRILLATDAASEGIDLQNHCHRLVHYEIPWNPNRMEQRNGRIDRHGQKSSAVMVYHFVGKGYREAMQSQRQLPPGSIEGDLEFLSRVAHKVEKIRTDLGKVGPVLARQVEEAMLGKRVSIDTLKAEEQAAAARKMFKFERDLKRQLRELKDKLDDSRLTLQLAPENLLAVVQVGLRLAKHPPLQPKVLARSSGAIQAFEVPALKGTWSEACKGLTHPHTRALRPVVFDEELARRQDDVVLMHLNHRLVQMCLRLLRAEVWGGRQLHRHAIFTAPRRDLLEPAVVAWGRLVLIGQLGHCLHEEILCAAGRIREGRLEPLNVTETERLIKLMQPTGERPDLHERLSALWPKLEKPLTTALKRREEARSSSLQNLLDRRKLQEEQDLRGVLGELEKQIRQFLNKQDADEATGQMQLDLWPADEKRQRERDHEALRRRLGAIPEELEKELLALGSRYKNPEPRLFPLAVTWLFPEGLS